MLNLSLTQRFWKIFSSTWLWKISMWPVSYHHIFAAGKFRRRLKGYYNNAINVRISLDGLGSKIRKVNRCRPTVSNETILATKQEFFFSKLAPVQSITDIVLLGFWLILLPGMFISSYTTIYFFLKNFFFSNVYISVNTIFECSYLSFGWEIGHPLSMYVTRGMEGSKMCTGAYRGRGVSRLMCTYALTRT